MDIEIRDCRWSHLIKFTVNVKADRVIQITTPIHSHWWVGQYPLRLDKHWTMRWYINKGSNVFLKWQFISLNYKWMSSTLLKYYNYQKKYKRGRLIKESLLVYILCSWFCKTAWTGRESGRIYTKTWTGIRTSCI